MRFSRNSARVHGADGEVIGEGEASPKHPPPSTLGQKFPLPFGAGEKSPPLRRWGKISSPLSPCRASGAILTVYTLHHLSFSLPRQRRDFFNLNLSNFRSQRIGLGPGRVRFRVGGKRFRVGGIGSGSAGQAKAKAKLRALNKRLKAGIGAQGKGQGKAQPQSPRP